MTATYDLDDLTLTSPSDGGVSNVRFFIGDTDVTLPQLQDEEINFALELRGNPYGATAMCARALSAKYSRVVNTSADGVSTANSQKAAQYRFIAEDYEALEAMRYAAPYAGGLSKADMLQTMSDPDRVPELFRYGLFDNPPNRGVDTNLDRPGSGNASPWNISVVTE